MGCPHCRELAGNSHGFLLLAGGVTNRKGPGDTHATREEEMRGIFLGNKEISGLAASLSQPSLLPPAQGKKRALPCTGEFINQQ